MPARESTDYCHLLRTPTSSVSLGFVGVLLGLVTFLLAAPVVSTGLGALGWLMAGRPGELSEYVSSLLRYEHPWGLVASHLGLAVLIPIAFGLVAVVHKGNPRLLWSVEGRLRWRLLASSLVAAVVVLVALIALQMATTSGPVTWSPQDQWAVFLLVVLVTSPLQAMAEEVFFRGYLMQAFGSMVAAPWFGIVTSAFVFAVFHAGQNAPLFAVRMVFGMIAGWLVWRTGGLEAGIAAHTVNNVLAFALAAFTGSISQVKATTQISWVDAGWDLLRFGLFAVLAAWIALRLRVPRVATERV